jgi:hypothetical protein
MTKNLKKLVFYIPFILFSLFYGMLLIGGELVNLPSVIIWISLFAISGFILSKNYFWGGLFGLFPAIHLMYMGTQDTGQIISETPIGIAIFVFYVGCGYIAYRNNSKSKVSSTP